MSLRISGRRGVLFVMVTALLAGACFLFSRFVTIRAAAQTSVHVTPFVLGQVSYSYRTNENGVPAMRRTTALRSDGSMVEMNTVGPVDQGVYMRAISLIDSSQIELSDLINGKTTWPTLPTREAAQRRARILHPPANCVFGGESLLDGHASLLGHSVALVRLAGSDHSPRVTVWRAQDLACTSLQSTVELPQPDGSFKLVAATKPVSLKLVEPDPSWFQGGEGYAELKPSEMAQKIRVRLCAEGAQRACAAEAPSSDADSDRRYEQLWATRR